MLRLHVLHHVARTRPGCPSLARNRANAGRLTEHTAYSSPISISRPSPQRLVRTWPRGLQVQQSCLSREQRILPAVQVNSEQDVFFPFFLPVCSFDLPAPSTSSLFPPPLVFSFLLIINKRSLTASSVLIGRSKPNLWCLYVLFS